jgi:hypothetical protein
VFYNAMYELIPKVWEVSLSLDESGKVIRVFHDLKEGSPPSMFATVLLNKQE